MPANGKSNGAVLTAEEALPGESLQPLPKGQLQSAGAVRLLVLDDDASICRLIAFRLSC